MVDHLNVRLLLVWKMIIKNLEEINKKYEVVLTDPPWPQTKGGKRKSRPNQGKLLDYSTMSIEDIKNIHKQVMDNLCADTHTVFMWTIEKYLVETLEFMQKLGYKKHCIITWDKENGVAPAFTIRYTTEYLIWFYKPKMIKIPKEMRGKLTTCIREKATKHSKKPEAGYQYIESLYPNYPKLEMYARNTRKGWDSWGNEL